MTKDKEQALRFSEICREQKGLKARCITSKYRPAKVHVYKGASGHSEEEFNRLLQEAREIFAARYGEEPRSAVIE